MKLEDRVAIITIDRPPVNALNRDTLVELQSVWDVLEDDERIKVVVVTGAGHKVFVAGADIEDIAALQGADAAREFACQGQALFDRIEASSRPVIGAINGHAIGGGLELALACHLRVVSEDAQLGSTESNLGIIPGWGVSRRLPRLVGFAKALELILTGDTVDAREAYRLGIANWVVPAERVLIEARALAARLSSKSRLTNEAALRVLLRGLEASHSDALQYEAERFSRLFESNDAAEGLAAFIAKRTPSFSDS